MESNELPKLYKEEHTVDRELVKNYVSYTVRILLAKGNALDAIDVMLARMGAARDDIAAVTPERMNDFEKIFLKVTILQSELQTDFQEHHRDSKTLEDLNKKLEKLDKQVDRIASANSEFEELYGPVKAQLRPKLEQLEIMDIYFNSVKGKAKEER